MKNSALFRKLIDLLETHEVENVIGIGEAFFDSKHLFSNLKLHITFQHHVKTIVDTSYPSFYWSCC